MQHNDQVDARVEIDMHDALREHAKAGNPIIVNGHCDGPTAKVLDVVCEQVAQEIGKPVKQLHLVSLPHGGG